MLNLGHAYLNLALFHKHTLSISISHTLSISLTHTHTLANTFLHSLNLKTEALLGRT
jgi:hypothetical protein